MYWLKRLARRYLCVMVGLLVFMGIGTGKGFGILGGFFEEGSREFIIVLPIVLLLLWWFAKCAFRGFLQENFPGLYRGRRGGAAQPRRSRWNHHRMVEEQANAIGKAFIDWTSNTGSVNSSVYDENKRIGYERYKKDKEAGWAKWKAQQNPQQADKYNNMAQRAQAEKNNLRYK